MTAARGKNPSPPRSISDRHSRTAIRSSKKRTPIIWAAFLCNKNLQFFFYYLCCTAKNVHQLYVAFACNKNLQFSQKKKCATIIMRLVSRTKKRTTIMLCFLVLRSKKDVHQLYTLLSRVTKRYNFEVEHSFVYLWYTKKFI